MKQCFGTGLSRVALKEMGATTGSIEQIALRSAISLTAYRTIAVYRAVLGFAFAFSLMKLKPGAERNLFLR